MKSHIYTGALFWTGLKSCLNVCADFSGEQRNGDNDSLVLICTGHFIDYWNFCKKNLRFKIKFALVIEMHP